MALDLDALENSLKKKLSELEKKRLQIEEELQALEVVKKASQAVEGSDEDEDRADELEVSGLDKAAAVPENTEALETDEGGDANGEVEEEVVEEEEAEEDQAEEDDGELSPEEAILEVIRTFREPLKAAKIAAELVAVGFPFDDAKPDDSVTGLLDGLAKEGKVKKMRTIKGTFFGLPE